MQKNKNLNNFDVGIIGGGPAGIMAAIEASQNGARVLLIEKNHEFGKKLLLTGGGRGNFTRAEFDPKKLAKNYGRKGDFLIHAFSEFGPKDVIEFFENLGLKSKTENDKRIFPESNSAQNILLALSEALEKNNVSVLTDCVVEKLEKSGNKISKIILAGGKEIICKKYIICTGGMSFSQTGSTGDGINWAKNLGHPLETVKPAIVPINIKEDWVKELKGLTIKSAGLGVFLNDKKKASFS
jgi:predicted Rossmann fold flavoprotein